MCLVRPWNVESLDKRIAPWLSQLRVVGKVDWKIEEKSLSSLWIQMISFDECVRAMYLASVLDKVMIGCFLELQETTPLPMKKVKPEMEWRWIWDAQSESE